ncbi:MAG: carboxypeptidase regulatory-like domain-containing protein [Treponema sp.]|nr:carboxypeptidase regulatory-like domain-containing protein [Treponema sp.]
MKYNRQLCFAVLLFSFIATSCSFITKSFDKKSGAYEITGVITDKKGSPVSDVAVSITDSNVTSHTDADGSYTLSGVTGSTVQLVAKKTGFAFVPSYEYQGEFASGSCINVASAASKGVVEGANFTAVSAVTISDIQGSGAESPLKNTFVANVTGVVTMVCYKTPHEKYDTTLIDGTTGPQWISEDGFFMEALPEDKDVSGKKSNGIFVITHDDNFEDSKWRAGFPTDLKEGDVVAVNGTVVETRKANRFNSSVGYLPRTGIDAAAVVHVQEGGVNKTAAYPDGVLLTYSQSKADAWCSGHEVDGKREARILPFNDTTKNSLQNAIDVLESVECMVVRIDEPIVVGGTYYNLTGVLADNGYNAAGERPKTWNSDWDGNVITENDFNTELLFVDYQSPSWTTFQPLAQIGDHLKDSTGERVFRGVLDYTDSGLYMARPINPTLPLTSVTGASIPAQQWAFDNDAVWYAGTAVESAMKTQKNADINGAIKSWRTGTASTSADPKFTPAWNTQVIDSDTLTLAAFNLENYEAQGGNYNLDEDLARIIKNNMLYPDVIAIVEMGDDVVTPITYQNQGNAYAPKDGNVTAVKNYSTIIEAVRANGGPEYEFRQIDPKDQDSGGKQGVNIRVGFMYNTSRVEFVDRGLVSNYYANTHRSDNTLLPQEEWPVHAWGDGQTGALLAETNTVPYSDESGVHITQSPGYIHSSYFNKSRRPLAGEFRFIASPSKPTFFVIACHLSSKMSDMPLYGQVQPPLLLSENSRNGQARTINDFVKKLLSYDANAKIIVAGDMNDFAYSTPARVLTGVAGGNQVLWSPAEAFMPVNEQFSYSYQGNLQQIDHIFVSESIYTAIKTTGTANWKDICAIPHINSLFCRNNHINFSDHDPDIVRLKGAF